MCTGPVFELDEDKYTVRIDDDAGKGLVRKPLQLTIKQLRTEFEHQKVVAALQVRSIRLPSHSFLSLTIHFVLSLSQCAGNRRKEMAQIEPVKGIIWDCGVIANCEWSGVRLRDILTLEGVAEEDLDNTHVWFSSNVSVCQDDKYYGGSVPLRKAMDPAGDVILGLDVSACCVPFTCLANTELVSCQMNGQPLSPDHGYPLRVIAPGYTGARWVKWVDHITVSHKESPNFYQQRDYRILPPHVKNTKDAEPVWDTIKSITSLPVNAVIASVRPAPCGQKGLVTLKGYAMGEGGPGKQIKKVQVAINCEDKEEWVDAKITYQDGPWSWTLWEGELDSSKAMEKVEDAGKKHEIQLLCRAEDEQGFVQKRQCAWNMRGVAFNAYGKAVWTW